MDTYILYVYGTKFIDAYFSFRIAKTRLPRKIFFIRLLILITNNQELKYVIM
jgi:hypothetical protein